MSLMDAILNRQNAQTIGIYHDSIRQTGERSLQESKRVEKRTAAVLQEHSDDQHDQLLQMIGENRRLKAQLAQRDEELLEQKDLVAFWANGNEAYRRTVQHLRQHWNPQNPAELPLKENAADLAKAKLAEVVNDPNWPAERAQKSEKRIQKRRQRQS